MIREKRFGRTASIQIERGEESFALLTKICASALPC